MKINALVMDYEIQSKINRILLKWFAKKYLFPFNNAKLTIFFFFKHKSMTFTLQASLLK